MNGVLIVDKPQGFTSFDVAAVIRRLCKTKKVGHTGTLDPMATGVLPILIGNAAKAQQFMPDHTKEYIADIKLGMMTDTLDITGRVIRETHPNVSKAQFQAVLPKFTGDLMQKPPMYSAVKIDGKRLYELAREGKSVDVPPRPITVYKLELLSFSESAQTAQIRVDCSSGTYIRSICADIGDMLGCGAALSALRRTRACGFDLTSAHTVEELKTLAESGGIIECVAPVESIFTDYGRISVSDAQAFRFKNGSGLDLNRLKMQSIPTDGEIIRVYSQNGTFIGLGRISKSKNELSFLKLFL